jgi:Uma2 family endonuclease
MSIAPSITTAAQLLQAGNIGRCELVRGRLIMMSPAGWDHGRLASRLDSSLRQHVETHNLGEVAAAETGFMLSRNPDTVRAPDVAFVSAARLSKLTSHPGFFPGAPDLAVEVLSPRDAAADVLEKVREWLDAGCSLVWIVDSKHKTVTAYRRDGQTFVHHGNAELTAEDVIPGFRLHLSRLFAD